MTRAKVHHVADLMLEVYSTLADLRYLDHEAIQHGPHNINITFCHEQNIGDSIIYLWQILPYIDLHAVEAEGFIFGGTFVDFRREEDIMNNRDPMYALDYDNQEDCGLECELDDNGELNLPYMGPEMTILSNLGNHQCVLVYDIESDRIWITDQLGGGSCDPALSDAAPCPKLNNNRNEFTHEPSRLAAEVLGDIIKWYRDLTEIPGGDGDYGVSGWDYEGFKAVYRKHGWPDHFDGDAFQADLARFKAHDTVTWRAQDSLREVEQLISWRRHSERSLTSATNSLFMATTLSQLWIAKFELHKIQQRRRRDTKFLQAAIDNLDHLCPGHDCRDPAMTLQQEVEYLRTELEYTTADRWMGARRRTRELAALSRAYKEAEAEAKPEHHNYAVRARPHRIEIPLFAEIIECNDASDRRRRDIKAVEEWLQEVPDDAPEAQDIVRLELQGMYEHHWDEEWRSRRYLRWQFREWLDPQRPWETCRIAK